MNQIIKLLQDIANTNNGMCEGGEQYPNAECCFDAVETLKRMQILYNIPPDLIIGKKVINCPICHGTKVITMIIDHEANGDSVWGETRCYNCDGTGKVSVQ